MWAAKSGPQGIDLELITPTLSVGVVVFSGIKLLIYFYVLRVHRNTLSSTTP